VFSFFRIPIFYRYLRFETVEVEFKDPPHSQKFLTTSFLKGQDVVFSFQKNLSPVPFGRGNRRTQEESATQYISVVAELLSLSEEKLPIQNDYQDLHH